MWVCPIDSEGESTKNRLLNLSTFDELEIDNHTKGESMIIALKYAEPTNVKRAIFVGSKKECFREMGRLRAQLNKTDII